MGRAPSELLSVLFARSPNIGTRHARKRHQLDRVDLDRHGPDRVAASDFDLRPAHSLNETVMSPEATSSRNSGLNCTSRR